MQSCHCWFGCFFDPRALRVIGVGGDERYAAIPAECLDSGCLEVERAVLAVGAEVEIGHVNFDAYNESSFAYIENNFLNKTHDGGGI